MLIRLPFCLVPALLAVYIPMCAPRVQPTAMPWDAHMAEFWRNPENLADRDLFYGPWGIERAPDPHATYTFVSKKRHGTNPGVVVTDPRGREWQVKQPPHNDQGAEGPVEVVLSRVLSAVGYHQPPLYFLPSFTMRDATGTHVVPGGRFRLHTPSLKKAGAWSWQQNPFVGTKPYQGLLVILVIFESSDLKNVNNSLYEFKSSSGPAETWYVVRDLGTALGETARLHPKRGNIDLFERERFITDVDDQGFVRFAYRGWHKELLEHRITPEEAQWAAELLQRLTLDQWMDAFRAGGYDEQVARRFIQQLKERIDEAYQVGFSDPHVTLITRPWPRRASR